MLLNCFPFLVLLNRTRACGTGSAKRRLKTLTFSTFVLFFSNRKRACDTGLQRTTDCLSTLSLNSYKSTQPRARLLLRCVYMCPRTSIYMCPRIFVCPRNSYRQKSAWLVYVYASVGVGVGVHSYKSTCAFVCVFFRCESFFPLTVFFSPCCNISMFHVARVLVWACGCVRGHIIPHTRTHTPYARTKCVLILLYVSSYCCIYVSSYYYIL